MARVMEFPELLLWDRARRFGVNSKEWSDSMKVVQASERRFHSHHWVLGVLNEIPDAKTRLRCLRDYVDYLLGPKKSGCEANPETYYRLMRNRTNLFYAMVKLRRKQNFSLEQMAKEFVKHPSRYNITSCPKTAKGLSDFLSGYRDLWGQILPPMRRGGKSRR